MKKLNIQRELDDIKKDLAITPLAECYRLIELYEKTCRRFDEERKSLYIQSTIRLMTLMRELKKENNT